MSLLHETLNFIRQVSNQWKSGESYFNTASSTEASKNFVSNVRQSVCKEKSTEGTHNSNLIEV